MCSRSSWRLADRRHGGDTLRNGALVLEDGVIAWIGTEAGLKDTRFESCEVRRFAGSTVLPGFVDAHTHFTLFANGTSYEEMATESNELMLMASVRNAGVHLRAGVTTARDNGSHATSTGSRFATRSTGVSSQVLGFWWRALRSLRQQVTSTGATARRTGKRNWIGP